MMRTAVMCFILAIVCCGLARAADGNHLLPSRLGSGYFLPSVTDPLKGSRGDVGDGKEDRSLSKQRDARTNSPTQTASGRTPAVGGSAKAADARPLGPPQPWTAMPIALGGLATLLVAALLLGLWFRAGRIRRGGSAGRFHRQSWSQSPQREILGASFIQTRLRSAASPQTVDTEEIEQSRRAA
jgi:hypothetical protein